jgi:hypothetical protein
MSSSKERRKNVWPAVKVLFEQGFGPQKICNSTGLARSTVYSWLRKYYPDYAQISEKRKQRIGDLYSKYKEIYIPFVFSKEDICKELNCKIEELECMFRMYNVSHQRLQAYHGQVTLCNVAGSFRKRIEDVVNKSNGKYRSVRDYCVSNLSLALLNEEDWND